MVAKNKELFSNKLQVDMFLRDILSQTRTRKEWEKKSEEPTEYENILEDIIHIVEDMNHCSRKLLDKKQHCKMKRKKRQQRLESEL